MNDVTHSYRFSGVCMAGSFLYDMETFNLKLLSMAVSEAIEKR